MQPALLCSAPPVKAVFGTLRPAKHDTKVRGCKRTAALAGHRLEKRLAVGNHRMPHASSSARRDMLARAEERDSLLVRTVHPVTPST